MKKYTAVACGILLALGLQGCEKTSVEERSQVRPVSIATVSLTDQAPQLTFPAVAAAADKSSLSFRISGEVARILVRPGDLVKKGQLLATLEPTDFKIEVDDKQAKYNVINSQYQRSAKLVAKGYLAQSQFDELKAQRSIAKANLDIAKLNLSFTQLRAPFDGVISRVPVEQFESVQIGQQVMNIHSTKMVDIDLQAPDMIYSQNSALEINNSKPDARVILPDGSEYKASLKEFTTEPDPESGAFLVTLTMPMPKDKFILDGMAVEVKADAQKLNVYRQGEPVVPLSAVFNEDGDSLDMAQKYVWVVSNENTVEKRVVVTDKVVPQGVRLVSGVKPNEKIVVAGGNRLRDGDKVRIVNNENKEAE